MSPEPKKLSFHAVDDIARAAARRKIPSTGLSTAYEAEELGPFMELLQFASSQQVPALRKWLLEKRLAPLANAKRKNLEVWLASSEDFGLLRTSRARGVEVDIPREKFLRAAKQTAENITGFSSDIARQLAAAIDELENNVHEHSQAPQSGIAAYHATPGYFEFVVSDLGIGVLNSLRTHQTYVTLSDEGVALRKALSDGVSRHAEKGRGMGFRPIFTGLANHCGKLRFRSGDHALEIDGTNPELNEAKIGQGPEIQGFFASVKCRPGSR